jgi:hypothetical protein
MTTVTSDVIHDGETGRWAYLVEGLDDDGLTILSFDNRARAEQSLMAMRAGNEVFAKAGAAIHPMGNP